MKIEEARIKARRRVARQPDVPWYIISDDYLRETRGKAEQYGVACEAGYLANQECGGFFTIIEAAN